MRAITEEMKWTVNRSPMYFRRGNVALGNEFNMSVVGGSVPIARTSLALPRITLPRLVSRAVAFPFSWMIRSAFYSRPQERRHQSQNGFFGHVLVAMSESPEVCQFSSTEAISQHCYNVSASN